MGFLDRFKKPRLEEADPWKAAPEPAAAAAPLGDPWKRVRSNPRVDGGSLKYRVLHLGAGALILLNIGIGVFFYSSNQLFNAALLVYLGFSTILFGHYFSLTRG